MSLPTTGIAVLSHFMGGEFVPVMDVHSSTEAPELFDAAGEPVRPAGALEVQGDLRAGHSLQKGLPTWMRPQAHPDWRLEFADRQWSFSAKSVEVVSGADRDTLIIELAGPVTLSDRSGNENAQLSPN